MWHAMMFSVSTAAFTYRQIFSVFLLTISAGKTVSMTSFTLASRGVILEDFLACRAGDNLAWLRSGLAWTRGSGFREDAPVVSVSTFVALHVCASVFVEWPVLALLAVSLAELAWRVIDRSAWSSRRCWGSPLC